MTQTNQQTTSIELGNKWSNQDVDVWELNSDGTWVLFRRNFSLWNYMGSLSEYPRLCAGAYLFPAGFQPKEQTA